MEIQSDIGNRILTRLDQWKKNGGELSSIVRFYYELLKIQSSVSSSVFITKPNLNNDCFRDRLNQGIPLLLFSEFQPDWEQVQVIFQQVAMWMVNDSNESLEEVDILKKISDDPFLLKAIVKDWYQGRSTLGTHDIAAIDKELLASLLVVTIKPFLFEYSQILVPQIDQSLWLHNYCPVCGGKPDFAYLDRIRGARWLICSRCDAEWLFLCLACPYCKMNNDDALSFFADDEKSCRYRFYVCDQCNTYIKAIDLRHTDSEILLPLERLMTLELDRYGQEKGYRPGWTTG